jgi:hypothetical protein
LRIEAKGFGFIKADQCRRMLICGDVSWTLLSLQIFYFSYSTLFELHAREFSSDAYYMGTLLMLGSA